MVRVDLPSGAYLSTCKPLFSAIKEFDSVHVYFAMVPLGISLIFFTIITLARNGWKLGNSSSTAGYGSAGTLLQGYFNSQLMFGFVFPLTALIMGFPGNNLSIKHHRLALAIASVYGTASIYSAALLQDDIGKRRRWLYLLIFTIFICAYTIIIIVGIREYGKEGALCIYNMESWKTLGTYSGAIGTVVITPIWFIAMLIVLFWLSFYDKQKLSMHLRAIVFISVTGMVIWQIIYIVGLRKLYLTNSNDESDIYLYKYIYDYSSNTYGDELIGYILSKSEVYGDPTIGQFVNYVIMSFPLLELAIAGIKRKLADRSKASAASQETGGMRSSTNSIKIQASWQALEKES